MRLKQAIPAVAPPVEIGVNPVALPVPLVVQAVQKKGPRVAPKSSVAASAL